MICIYFFFFKQKTAYEVRISDWSSDVCSSDLIAQIEQVRGHRSIERRRTRDNDLVRHAGFEVEIDIVDAGRRHRQAAADVEIPHNARAARIDGYRIGERAGTKEIGRAPV